MADNNTFDAIVVGSGISGGWAAKELTERGLNTIMLERGFDIKHGKDYEASNKPVWEYPHRGGKTQQMIADYPKLKRDYPLNERNLHFWASDKDCPYTETKRFDWFRGYHVGGRSLMWGRQSYRWSETDFEANAKDGIAIDWPIRYKDIESWYTYVEKFAGIQGSYENLAILPDSHFLPAMELNIVEKDVAAKIKAHYNNKRTLIIGRTAHVTGPLGHSPQRTNCQYRDMCWNGCPFGAYFSTQSSTLPAAMATGKLTLGINSIVTEIIYDKDTKRAKGVRVINAETKQATEYFAKVVFLCASAFNSAWVLMNSATDVWPDGLGSSSGELGHNVMDHHFRCGAEGIAEGFDDKYYFGHRPTGFYIPRFRNIGDDKRDYIRGFGYQGAASRTNWGREVAELNIGAELKDALSSPGGWKIGATAFGEMLPYHDNKISLNKNVKDKWNLPVLDMDVSIRENEMKMRSDMKNDMKEMLDIAGVKNTKINDNDYAPGMGIHEMGVARMGRDPKTSVLNANNQVWDCLNVFVTDGACMTSASCVNPSLTYMALTARAAAFAVDELKKMNV
ncbi:MAG TPA: GMC family oxidoreductase [Chitinophagaceae bacterium]